MARHVALYLCVLVAAPVLLSGCAGPGGGSDEDRQLNEAAAALDLDVVIENEPAGAPTNGNAAAPGNEASAQ